jgi:hypothetical protein
MLFLGQPLFLEISRHEYISAKRYFPQTESVSRDASPKTPPGEDVSKLLNLRTAQYAASSPCHPGTALKVSTGYPEISRTIRFEATA